MKVRIIFLMILLFLFSNSKQSFTQDKKKQFKYTGVIKCKTCHKGSKKGAIYEIWHKSKHAEAYKTLGTKHALETAEKLGLEGNPQEIKKCVKCHITGYGIPSNLKLASLTLEEGVSCEACHGPGSEYRNFRVMKSIYKNEIKPESYGLIVPKEKDCIKCHNQESPAFTGFDFNKAMQSIKHSIPKKK